MPAGFTIQAGQGTAQITASTDLFTGGNVSVIVSDGTGGPVQGILYVGVVPNSDPVIHTISATPNPVYREETKAFADFSVYVTETEAFADCVIYRESSRAFADQDAVWFFETSEAFADRSVYFETTQAFADLVIAWTDSRAFARCEKAIPPKK